MPSTNLIEAGKEEEEVQQKSFSSFHSNKDAELTLISGLSRHLLLPDSKKLKKKNTFPFYCSADDDAVLHTQVM